MIGAFSRQVSTGFSTSDRHVLSLSDSLQLLDREHAHLQSGRLHGPVWEGSDSVHFWRICQDGWAWTFVFRLWSGASGKECLFRFFILKNGPFPASFFRYFCLFQHLTANMFVIKLCRRLDSNCGPWVSEKIPLLTVPQRLFNACEW